MTAFIIRKVGGHEQRYIVKDAQCLGRNCLRLGMRTIQKNPLMFSENPLEALCCVMMIDKGCPTHYKSMFSIELRTKHIKAGLGARII